MRYVPIGCIRETMVLGKSIYGSDGQLLLTKGTVLNDKYKSTIRQLGFSGVYIKDNLSDEIEIESVITDELRRKTIAKVKDVFLAVDDSIGSRDEKINELRNIVDTIMKELLANENLMINMIDLKFFDEYTYQHSVNVGILAMVIGVAYGLKKQDIYNLGLSALLHDIGKVFIDKDILNKPGRLTDEEYEIMKKHPKLGYEYLKNNFHLPTLVNLGSLDHHEKVDGTGYPNGKVGDEISLFGKIISLVDVYDALTSERPYRSALLPSEAVEYLMGGTDTYFDHEIIKIFTTVVAPYPLGTCIKLSNGYSGIVVENFPYASLRPKVKAFRYMERDVEPFIIDLSCDKNYLNTTIEKIVYI